MLQLKCLQENSDPGHVHTYIGYGHQAQMVMSNVSTGDMEIQMVLQTLVVKDRDKAWLHNLHKLQVGPIGVQCHMKYCSKKCVTFSYQLTIQQSCIILVDHKLSLKHRDKLRPSSHQFLGPNHL
jgi:hypothetical protein